MNIYNTVRDRDAERVYLDKIYIRNYLSGSQYPIDEQYKYDLNDYVNKIPVIKHLMKGAEIRFNSPISFIVGENGTGKSTILEAISVGLGLNGEGGDKYTEFKTKRDYSDLYRLLRISYRKNPKDWFFLRGESFYNLSTEIDRGKLLGNFGNRDYHKMSHGESILYLIRNRFQGNGLYLLDEPEVALSARNILEFMKEIKRLVELNSQFIIVTHSPILITYPDACIYECSMRGLREVGYTDLDSFNVTRDFLNNPEYHLRNMGL